MKLADLRTEYRRETLDVAQVDRDPIGQFGRWFDEAVQALLPEPNAMTLATVDERLRPAARIVLLKGFDEAGFVFFTNYRSRKGAELAARPHATLLFYWIELERQVRIDGVATRIDAAESDAYFAVRPRDSRLGAWASPQSEPVESREALEARFTAVAAQYEQAADDIPRPPHWGGYRMVPDMFEFWQGRPSRMHDRIRYRRNPASGAWAIDRLAP